MSAVAKAHHTNKQFKYPLRFILNFKRTTPRWILQEVAQKYQAYISPEPSVDDDEEIIRVVDSDWYQDMSKEMNPGKYLKTLCESCGLTLAELAHRLNSSPARICDYEFGRRQVSKAVAKKLSSIFLVGADKFI
jgi:hypothetical protein